MRLYKRLIETNDWENERWSWYIEWEGNQVALNLLETKLKQYDPNGEQYKLDGKIYNEKEVDLLVEHAEEGYYRSHNKLKGKLRKYTIENIYSLETLEYVLAKGSIREIVKEDK